MFAVFGAIIAAFQFQSDLIRTNMAISDMQTKKIQEKFTITAEQSGNALAKVLVNNQGANPIEVVDLWVINKNGPFDAPRYSINSVDSFVPAGSITNIIANSPQIYVGTGTYLIKAVTALGSLATYELSADTTVINPESLIDKLVARPSIYAAFPNPVFSNAKGHFAMIVANPTPYPLWINRTSLQLISGFNPDILVDGTLTSEIDPSSGTWTKSKNNYILYEAPIGGIKINKYGVKVFSANVTANSQVKISPINTINTNTYSTLGQFGGTKIDTISTLSYNNCAVPNVSLYNSTSKRITYAYSGLLEKSNITVNATLENTGPSDSNNLILKDKSILIVNIPKVFTNINAGNTTDFQIVDASNKNYNGPITMQDGSNQLRLKLLNNISPSSSTTYSFTVKTPDVSSTTLYLFYIYAVGALSGGGGQNCPTNTIMGPVAETVFQVCPDATCG